MMLHNDRESIFETVINLLELPDSAYESAKKRYEDLGEYFGREESSLSCLAPHVFAQGSFRLGTAIRPILEDEEYDLDLSCELQKGINKNEYTQERLKEMVGSEIEKYRQSRGIKDELEEKKRCWRLSYQDKLNFHMDIVPSIPSDQGKRVKLFESMRKDGSDESLAKDVTRLSVDITDNTLANYREISPDWMVSNPEGYAKWFESRMMTNLHLDMAKAAQIDDLPIYKRKTPLQRAVQILKRHRDVRFKNDPDLKPISVIITTLAARSYNGEQSLQEALVSISQNMEKHVRPYGNRVPNPVNSEEDFADKWKADPRLEQNFKSWVLQVKADISSITELFNAPVISRRIDDSFKLHLDESILAKIPSMRSEQNQPNTPRVISPVSPRPWVKL